MTSRKAIIALLGAAALAAAPGVALSKTRTVLVTDNYYGPSKLTVHVGDTVAVTADDPAAGADVQAWCRMRVQEYAGEETAADGVPTYLVRRLN